MTISMRELAKIANVTPATVSYALRNKGTISPETRERIQKLAQELNYRPNKLANGVFCHRSYSIGVLFGNIGSFYAPILDGLIRTVMANGLTVQVATPGPLGNTEREAIHMLLERRADGFIVVPMDDGADPDSYWEIKKDDVPLVVLDRKLDFIDADFVCSDNAKGIHLVLEHLFSLGHQRIAYLGMGDHIWTMRQRRQAFINEMQQAGFPLHKNWTACLSSLSLIEQQIQEWFRQDPTPTAIVCGNDEYASAAFDTLRQLGLRVPAHVSLVGFGNLEFGKHMTPKLTTVDQNTYLLAKTAANLLVQRIEEKADIRDAASPTAEKKQYRSETVDVRLVQQESTASPHSRSY